MPRNNIQKAEPWADGSLIPFSSPLTEMHTAMQARAAAEMQLQALWTEMRARLTLGEDAAAAAAAKQVPT